MRQELDLSIATPYAAIEEPLRELLLCTLAPDPNVRCSIEKAARFAERMLAVVKLDSDRIFEAQLSKKGQGFCKKKKGNGEIEKKGQGFCATSSPNQGSLPHHRRAETAELRGLGGSYIRDADAFLVPLIRKGRTKGTVESLESALTAGGHASDALALRAALPLSLKAWDKYRPDLVNRSVIEIDTIRLPNGGDEHLAITLAKQPKLLEDVRQAAKSKGLWVQFRIESTPLDFLKLQKKRKIFKKKKERRNARRVEKEKQPERPAHAEERA